MHYFQEFPKVREQIGSQYVDVIDITTRVKFLDYLQKNESSLIIEDYQIKNGQRPEQVSMKLYSSYDFTWTILLLNKVYNIFEDWYQPQEIVDKKIVEKYGSIDTCNRVIANWYDQYGYEVSPNNLNRAKSRTMLQKIIDENEAKKNIRVLSSKHIDQVQRNFRSLLA